jgi:hypothetical protein
LVRWTMFASVAVMLAMNEYMTGQTISVNRGTYLT